MTIFDSGKTFPTLDPRTGQVVANAVEWDAEGINHAVFAAREAAYIGCLWSKILLRFADLVDKHANAIAGQSLGHWEAVWQATVNDVRLFLYYAGRQSMW